MVKGLNKDGTMRFHLPTSDVGIMVVMGSFGAHHDGRECEGILHQIKYKKCKQ